VQKGALVNSIAETLKKSRLRERTDRARFSRLVRHLARKWSRSILTTPEPARHTGQQRERQTHTHTHRERERERETERQTDRENEETTRYF